MSAKFEREPITLELLGAEMTMKRSVHVDHWVQIEFVTCESLTINGIEYGGYFRIEKRHNGDALTLDLAGMNRKGVMGGIVGMTDAARVKLVDAFKSEVFPNIVIPSHEEMADAILDEYRSKGGSLASELLRDARSSTYRNREHAGYVNDIEVREAMVAGFVAYMAENGVSL
ncbi:hypothetical protein AUR04nite_00350 [Glutamicibacter uratoxydans]|uniref:Uncharacterized protein n=1 Tax=Glutamicibacter uratoxydans TaxID=43667 RepID=A0A4Y4DIY1_GLUUR|nr:hypothetical protein [Glutamicibacter uratoxydans]GED04503.1 hypothetical protein AUR04nite_00350 [Glutamicibacter uratoxydans]